MPCPVCDHTMHNVGLDRVFWCPRCGTLKSDHDSHGDAGIPKLVEHIRTAESMTVRTSVDGRSIQYAVPSPFWIAACEAVGRKAHGAP